MLKIEVTRCLFPEGRAVLCAHDMRGKFIIGIGKRPKNVTTWILNGVSAADKKEMQREAEEHLREQPRPHGTNPAIFDGPCDCDQCQEWDELQRKK